MATIAEELAKAAVTDSLNRAENPIAAPWVKMNPGTSAGKCVNVAPVGYTPVTSFATGEDECYWSTSAFSSSTSQYIYGIFTLSRVGSTERQTGVWLCRDEAKPVETQNGYLLRLEKKAGANEIKFTIEKWTGGSAEVIKELTTTEFIAGAQIAFVIGNNKAYMFATTTEGGTYEEKMSVETTTYTKGYSGMRAKGTGEFIIKDFRTGTFTIGATGNVRRFKSGDFIRTAIGKCTSAENFTMACLARVETKPSAAATMMATAKPGQSSLGWTFGFDSEGHLQIQGGGAFCTLMTELPTFDSAWKLFAVTNDGFGGAARPLFYTYDFSKGAWTIQELSGQQELNNTSEIGSGGIVAFGENGQGKQPLAFDLALAGFWNQACSRFALARLVNLSIYTYLREWRNQKNESSGEEYPAGMWLFNQGSISTPITDMCGGKANQIARSGTEVLAGVSIPRDYGAGLVYVKKGTAVSLKPRKTLRNGVLV